MFFGVFLVRIFSHLDWIRRFTLQISIFSGNEGKYWPEKFRIWTLRYFQIRSLSIRSISCCTRPHVFTCDWKKSSTSSNFFSATGERWQQSNKNARSVLKELDSLPEFWILMQLISKLINLNKRNMWIYK